MFRRLLIVCIVSALTGCADIYPPDQVQQPTMIGVVNYGRHTSLLLPDAQSNVTEWCYGDWSFCAEGNRGIHVELGAVLLPTEAALGRRQFGAPIDSPGVRYLLEGYTITKITVERTRVEALSSELTARFNNRADEARYAPDFDMYFVPAGEAYGLWSTCNNAMAKWLRALGCEVIGCTQTGDFVIHDP